MKLHFDEIGYGDNILVKSGEIEIKEGTIALIKGRNGRGKSSLIRNLFLNDKNSDFDMVYIDQKNRKLNKKLGIIGNISMRNDIEFNNRIILELDELGCAFLLDKKVDRLSGGEKRLIYILRAYFADENIVILDEPTNDLDYKSVDVVKKILLAMKKSKEVILISHDGRMAEISDDIYEIQNKVLIKLKGADAVVKADHPHIMCYKDKSIIRHFIRKNYISIAILSFMVYTLIYGMKHDILDRIEKKQIESVDECVITWGLQTAVPCDEYAMVPLAMARMVEDKDMTGMVRYLYKKSKEIQDIATQKKIIKKYQDSVRYELGYYETEDFVVYPISYDPEAGLSINIFDYYATHCYPDMDPCYIYVDTGKYFERGKANENAKITIELEFDEYLACVDALKDKHPLEAVIVRFKNDNGFDAFLNSDYGKTLAQLDMQIYKSEFRDFIYEAKAITDFVKRVEECLYMIALCLLFSIIMLIMQLLYYKDQIIVLRNHNFMLEDIEDYLIYKFPLRIFRILAAFVIVISNYWLYRNIAFSSVNYYWSLLGILSVSYMYKFEIKISSFYLKRLYRWEEQ